MNTSERLVKEMKRQQPIQRKQFADQFDQFEQLKKKLHRAGLTFDDSYQIPLMNRIGHTTMLGERSVDS